MYFSPLNIGLKSTIFPVIEAYANYFRDPPPPHPIPSQISFKFQDPVKIDTEKPQNFPGRCAPKTQY